MDVAITTTLLDGGYPLAEVNVAMMAESSHRLIWSQCILTASHNGMPAVVTFCREWFKAYGLSTAAWPQSMKEAAPAMSLG